MGNEITISQVQHDATDYNKRTSKIQASYKLEGTVFENIESIKYHCVTIN